MFAFSYRGMPHSPPLAFDLLDKRGHHTASLHAKIVEKLTSQSAMLLESFSMVLISGLIFLSPYWPII